MEDMVRETLELVRAIHRGVSVSPSPIEVATLDALVRKPGQLPAEETNAFLDQIPMKLALASPSALRQPSHADTADLMNQAHADLAPKGQPVRKLTSVRHKTGKPLPKEGEDAGNQDL
jgi:hypothetical protein